LKSADLIDRARATAKGKRRPRSADLRRAVSDLYYAVFHRIAAMSGDALVGGSRRKTDAWKRVYRALEHRRAKEEFKKLAMNAGDPGKRTLAIAFIDLQELRHSADYDPSFPFARRSDLFVLIAQAEAALVAVESLTADTRVELATQLLFLSRK
jgi:uncharacterized protein (UPF0332 family)